MKLLPGLLAAILAAVLAPVLKVPARDPPPASLEGLRYNEVQFKAAHNSIDRDEALKAQLDWNPETPHEGGCRGLELDIVLDPARLGPGDEWTFGVQHGGPYRQETPKLAACLREIRAWADAHPRHDVITVHIDLKVEATVGDDGLFSRKVDDLLARELGKDRIFTPARLQQDEPTLLAAVRKRGWPTLGELRGKFILVFSGSDAEPPVARRRRAYLSAEPKERLAFVDLDQRTAGLAGGDECDIQNPYYNEGSRIFLNLQLGRKEWTRLARDAGARGFVTREWKANDEPGWRAARDCGVNVLSTDRIGGAPWASVGREPFARIDAGLRPSRVEARKETSPGRR